MNRLYRPRVFLVAALGVPALLALPATAAAKSRDRNHDHIPDRWEKRHHLSLKVKQTRRDQDHDHLNNRQEFLAGTNPRNPDSNGDGIPDGRENAGTIQSFDSETGQLVINLFGGETVSGLVTEETEIECGRGQTATASHTAEDESGDDAGGQGEGSQSESGDGEAEENSAGTEPTSSGSDDNGTDDAEHGECTPADLVEGEVVREADLTLESGTATFEKIELAG